MLCCLHYLWLKSLDRRSSVASTPKGFEKAFYRGYFKDFSHHGHISHRLCRNWKELTKQINQSVELQHHSKDGPPQEHQHNTAEKGNNSAHAIRSAKETKGSGDSDCQCEAREEENVTESEHSRVKEEETSQKEKDAAEKEQTGADFCVVGDHNEELLFFFIWKDSAQLVSDRVEMQWYDSETAMGWTSGLRGDLQRSLFLFCFLSRTKLFHHSQPHRHRRFRAVGGGPELGTGADLLSLSVGASSKTDPTESEVAVIHFDNLRRRRLFENEK